MWSEVPPLPPSSPSHLSSPLSGEVAGGSPVPVRWTNDWSIANWSVFFFLLFLVFPFFVVVPLRFSTKRGERDGKEQKTPPRTKKGKVFTHTLLALDFFFKSPTKINQKKKAERGFFFLKEKENQEDFGGTSCSHFTKCNKIFPAKFYKSVAIQEKQTNKQTYISYLQRHEEEPLCYV